MEVDVQANGNAEEPLLGRGVLGAVVDLLPKSEVVVCAAMKVTAERDSSYAVEHDK